MKMLSGRVAVPGDPPHGRVAILVGCLSLGRLDAGGHATASGDRAVGQGGRLQRVSYSSGPHNWAIVSVALSDGRPEWGRGWRRRLSHRLSAIPAKSRREFYAIACRSIRLPS